MSEYQEIVIRIIILKETEDNNTILFFVWLFWTLLIKRFVCTANIHNRCFDNSGFVRLLFRIFHSICRSICIIFFFTSIEDSSQASNPRVGNVWCFCFRLNYFWESIRVSTVPQNGTTTQRIYVLCRELYQAQGSSSFIFMVKVYFYIYVYYNEHIWLQMPNT